MKVPPTIMPATPLAMIIPLNLATAGGKALVAAAAGDIACVRPARRDRVCIAILRVSSPPVLQPQYCLQTTWLSLMRFLRRPVVGSKLTRELDEDDVDDRLDTELARLWALRMRVGYAENARVEGDGEEDRDEAGVEKDEPDVEADSL